jgi:thiol-disulfide isomerase/thioredoxin
MLRVVMVIVALGLLVFGCGKVSEMAVVEGRVLGADGKPPALGHVHLVGLGDGFRAALKSVGVGDDGAFTMSIPRDRYYELAFTAANHRSLRVPLPLDLKKGIKSLEVTLAPNEYTDPPADVAILGDWNGFNLSEAEPMTPLGDGTFAYARKVEADTLAYQLLNATIDNRSVNGTDADHYRYDGGGDYISVVKARGDSARVIFDPKTAVAAASQDLPRLGGLKEGHPVGEVFEIAKRYALDFETESAAMQKYWAEHGGIEGFAHDASAIRQYLMGMISGRGAPAVRKYAAVKLADLLTREQSLTADELAAIKNLLPPSEWVWAVSPEGLVEFFTRTEGSERMAEMFDRDLAKVADRRAKAAMLLEIGLAARDTGDSARQKEIYDDLSNNYGDANLPAMLQYRLASELNPNLRINKGKPLPDFELALLDGSGKVSRQTLLGKYTLIDFWATWCGPCVGELPNLHKAYEKFKGPNFEILSISLDQHPGDVAAFRADKWSMPWLHAYADGMFDAEIAKTFEVNGIPKPILVDPQGKIVGVGMDLRGENLMAVLARCLPGT